jgi:hypothetical protein
MSVFCGIFSLITVPSHSLFLLLCSTEGERSISSSKEIRRWFAKAFGFALRKRYSRAQTIIFFYEFNFHLG